MAGCSRGAVEPIRSRRGNCTAPSRRLLKSQAPATQIPIAHSMRPAGSCMGGFRTPGRHPKPFTIGAVKVASDAFQKQTSQVNALVGPERQPVGQAKSHGYAPRHPDPGRSSLWVTRLGGSSSRPNGQHSIVVDLSPDRCRVRGLQEGRSFAARKGSVREAQYGGRIQ